VNPADESDGASEGGVFQVDTLVDSRVNSSTNEREFKVLWKGFGPGNATWEPESHILNSDLVTAFDSLPATERDRLSRTYANCPAL